MAEQLPNMFPTLPETLLNHRKKHEDIRQAQIAAQKATTMLCKDQRKDILKYAEQYVKEDWQKERNEILLKRKAKKSKNFYIPDEPKIAFVIRIKGINGVSPRVRNVLWLLRLRHINNSVFIKLNKASVNIPRLLEP